MMPSRWNQPAMNMRYPLPTPGQISQRDLSFDSAYETKNKTRKKYNQYGNSINDLEKMKKRREDFINKGPAPAGFGPKAQKHFIKHNFLANAS